MAATEAWEARRSSFHHDWMKAYAIRLEDWANILRGDVEDPQFDSLAAHAVLQEWQASRNELARLADTYPTEMSPSLLFGRWPLSGCVDGQRRLVEIVAVPLWRARMARDNPVERLRRAVRRADLCCRGLARRLGTVHGPLGPPSAPRLAVRLRAFQAACGRVSRALTSFPRQIAVV